MPSEPQRLRFACGAQRRVLDLVKLGDMGEQLIRMLPQFAIALVVLVFTFINLNWADPVDPESAWLSDEVRRTWAYSAIRQSIAAILVAFPVFLWLWRSLLREIARHPEKAASKARVVFTYISLGVALVTLVSDVITLVYYLLEGELTTRFVLKVVALFLVAGSACLYLALTLREGKRPAGVEAA